MKRPRLTYHQRTRHESRWWFCPPLRRGRRSQASRGADRARVTTSASIRYIIDAAEAFKLSWKYRPAVRVINVPPPYKVLNFRSVRRRNISCNTATAAQRNAAVYQPDENYNADEDVNIGEPGSSGLYSTGARARARLYSQSTLFWQKGTVANFTEDFMRNSVVVASGSALSLDDTCAINRTCAPKSSGSLVPQLSCSDMILLF